MDKPIKDKLDFDTIKAVLEVFSKNKPPEVPELKCGKLFEKALIDRCSDVLIKDVPFATAVINPYLFGIPVILDETLPANYAKIGNTFLKLEIQ